MTYKPAYDRPLDGSMSSSPDGRLLEVILGVKGACEGCQPRRVKATTLIKVRCVGQALIESCGDTEPFELEHRFCDSCRDDYFAPEAQDLRPEWKVETLSVDALP